MFELEKTVVVVVGSSTIQIGLKLRALSARAAFGWWDRVYLRRLKASAGLPLRFAHKAPLTSSVMMERVVRYLSCCSFLEGNEE